MSEQDSVRPDTLQRPIDDKEAWKAYWEQQGQPWRSEPEIDAERQSYLSMRRKIPPDIERGSYPFKDIKLDRADVEWLLATHENKRGPVDWSDESQRKRMGLDLRAANLSKTNLTSLPLARLYAGLTKEERSPEDVDRQQRNIAAAHLEGTNLRGAHLEGAYLARTHMEDANLENTYLEESDLSGAHLEGATLRKAHLEGAYLSRAFFSIASNLNYIILSNKKLGCVSVDNVNWNGVNLGLVEWGDVDILGDERRAREKKTRSGQIKKYETRFKEYVKAVRANRKLAVALQSEGLNEEASHFFYRAQVLQRKVVYMQMQQQGITIRRKSNLLGAFLLSGFLSILSGYGYRLGRAFLSYSFVIVVFAIAYSILGHLSLWPPDAFVYSMTSFHGRGFFPGFGNGLPLHHPLIMLAAFEALVGLIIEVTLIVTLTQRFFRK